MPWLFDTPISVGAELDPNAPGGEYTHCRLKLVGNHPDVPENPHMTINVAYGWMADGDFVRGAAHPGNRLRTYRMTGALYATEVTTARPLVALVDPGSSDYVEVDVGGTPVWVELTYVASKRGLYEHLRNQGIIPLGTIV